MNLLTLLLLVTSALSVFGATLEGSDSCNKEVKCAQTDYKEYINCLEKKRVKRQTCLYQNPIITQTVPRLITCTIPNCYQNVVQNVDPCIGGASYCECFNSCSTSCSGYNCGDRCARSCPVITAPTPQIIYLPIPTTVRPIVSTTKHGPVKVILSSVAPPTITKETSTVIGSLSPNITTNIQLTNIVNNTNIINVPTNINNTNINNVDLGMDSTANLQPSGDTPQTKPQTDTRETIDERCCYIMQPKSCEKGPSGGNLCTQRQIRVCGEQCLDSREETGKNTDIQRCCVVVQPRVCEKINSSKGGVRCIHRKHHTCGEECTSDTIHVQVRQPCNGPPSVCSPQVAYIPQPQPRCSYQPAWPYVSCGNKPSSCGGCYDHYGYGFQQYFGNSQQSCSGCYDDGYQPGSLYRQGPFYQQGNYHTPPLPYATPPIAQTSCGSSGCFGNDRVDPVFGAPSYSPYGASSFYYPPQYLPQPENMQSIQYPPWSQFPPYLIPPCFIPPYYQPQQCSAPFFPPHPVYPPFPFPVFPSIVDPSSPGGSIPLPPVDQGPPPPVPPKPQPPSQPVTEEPTSSLGVGNQ